MPFTARTYAALATACNAPPWTARTFGDAERARSAYAITWGTWDGGDDGIELPREL